MNYNRADITVIVPILDEAAELPGLLASLSAQEHVRVELFLCDGGSSDGSHQIFSEIAAKCTFPARLIQSARGRGCQMNAGADAASSDLLLFLHADSRFEDTTALCKAVALYRRHTASGSPFFAARFGLKFHRSEQSPALSYFFYEAKARLPRTDCIRGDQGFLLDSRTFFEAGKFDESLPFLEDIRLVESLPRKLVWLLLPSEISTSARRFEKEGLLERQVLNAIIVNSIAAGWTEFFQALPGIYHCHADTGRLLLSPLLKGIDRLIADNDPAWRRTFWRSTGRHVARNAWQIFFWLDTRRAFRGGKDVGEVSPNCLNFYGLRLETLFQGRLAAILAQIAVKFWLRWMLFKGTSRTT